MKFEQKIIPIAPAGGDPALTACSDAEPFALMVLGDSMEPEFADGEIIVIEPEGLATDGSFVLAWHNEEYIFRQLVKTDAGWALHALNPAYEDAGIPGLDCVKGVIIQKKKPGSRKSIKHYVKW